MDPQEPYNPERPQGVEGQNPETPQTPKDNHGITVAAMAVFVLLSLTAVAFLYYQNQQLKTMLASYQLYTPQPTPIVTIQETASPSATPLKIKTTPTASSSATPKACTQEAKLCPNGTYVGRTGPNCEFAPCPTP